MLASQSLCSRTANSLLPDASSRCTLTYEPDNQLLRATWDSFVSDTQARRGASDCLAELALLQVSCLLNDNQAMRGTWFSSTDWLEQVWLPQALRLGLRSIAHVIPACNYSDVLTLSLPTHQMSRLDLQLFDNVIDATAWLRSTQQPVLLVNQ